MSTRPYKLNLSAFIQSSRDRKLLQQEHVPVKSGISSFEQKGREASRISTWDVERGRMQLKDNMLLMIEESEGRRSLESRLLWKGVDGSSFSRRRRSPVSCWINLYEFVQYSENWEFSMLFGRPLRNFEIQIVAAFLFWSKSEVVPSVITRSRDLTSSWILEYYRIVFELQFYDRRIFDRIWKLRSALVCLKTIATSSWSKV